MYDGRLIPEKGLHVLVKAMQIVKKENPDAKLLAIVCNFSENKGYFKKVIGMDSGFLEFKHKMPIAELVKTFQQSTCVVFPPVRKDSFGLVQIEAMACGCPVICSSLPGPAEICKKHGGLIFEKGNAEDCAKKIEYVLKNGLKIRKPNYSWEKCNSSFMKLYSSK